MCIGTETNVIYAAVALRFQHYNFARPHKSLKNPYPRTPAMAAEVADHVWTLQEIAALLDLKPRSPAAKENHGNYRDQRDRDDDDDNSDSDTRPNH